jgi:predicted metal-dependent hydrolase
MSERERSGTVRYGDELIGYEVVERPRRRTLGIEVHPDGRVLALVPVDCQASLVEQKLRLRSGWISRQLALFSRYERGAAQRHYVSGESHRYLGRQYRLCVAPNDFDSDSERVRLLRGELRVTGPGKLPPVRVKELLRRWYLQRAREVFSDVLDECFDSWARRNHERPRIVVREMRSRWGSLSPAGQMTLNSRLVQAPRRCIEYVIVHELCHLIHRNHGSAFAALLGRVMPDWKARKERLESMLP